MALACIYNGQELRAGFYEEQGLASFKSLGRKYMEFQACRTIGNAYKSTSNWNKAIKYYQICFELGEQFDATGRTQGRACWYIAECYNQLEKYKESCEVYNKALSIFRTFQDECEDIGILHINLANVCLKNCDYTKAEEHFRQGLFHIKETKNREEELRACLGLAMTFQEARDGAKSIEFGKLALSISKEIGDKENEMKAQDLMGSIHKDILRQYGKAIQCYKECLKISEEKVDRVFQIWCYDNLSVCYCHSGDYRKAVEYGEKQLNVAQSIGHKVGEATAEKHLGDYYGMLGLYEEAAGHVERELKAAENDQQWERLHRLGFRMMISSNFELSIKFLEKALKIATEQGNKEGQLTVLYDFGVVFMKIQDKNKSIQCFLQALKLSRDLNKKVFQHKAAFGLGWAFYKLKDYEQANKFYTQALNLNGRLLQTGHGLFLGLNYFAMEKYKEASIYLKDYIERHEKKDELLGSIDEWKIAFADEVGYDCLTVCALAEGKVSEALAIAERGRGRALENLLSSKFSLDLTSISQTNPVDDTAFELQTFVKQGCTTLFYSVVEDETIIWLLEYGKEVVFSRISTSDKLLLSHVNQSYNCLDVRGVSDCEDRSLSFLHKGISRSSEHERVSAQGSNHLTHDGCNELPITQISENSANKADETIQEKNPSSKTEENALEALHRKLIGPVLEKITTDELVIVPHKSLNRVPFAALKSQDGRYLSQDFRIRVIPSLMSGFQLSERNRDTKVDSLCPLIIGDPDVPPFLSDGEVISIPRLPGSKQEAEDIAALLGAKPLTDKEATKVEVLRRLNKASLVHIAAHGNAEKGEILLAPSTSVPSHPTTKKDCILGMADVHSANIQAKLVVLSCCHSGKGEVMFGNDFLINKSFSLN